MSPPDLKDIEKQLGVNRNKLTEVLRLLERDRSVIRVATDLYYLSSTIDQVRAVLKKFLAEKGEITAGSFRDLINSSRKYTIPLLEYFDREDSPRIGDIRRLKSSPSAGK
jgi:selenocysteine-specific elongation factor